MAAGEPRRVSLDRARQHPRGVRRRQRELLPDPRRETVLRPARREHAPERGQIREHDGDVARLRGAGGCGRARHVAIARQSVMPALARLVHHEAHEVVAVDAAADVARMDGESRRVESSRELRDDRRLGSGKQAEMLREAARHVECAAAPR